MIEILPGIAYTQALEEPLRADGLVVTQGANCNGLVPAKLYQDFRTGRPILGLADPRGDTGRSMRSGGVAHIAALEDAGENARVLPVYLSENQPGCDSAPLCPQHRTMSKRARAAELAEVLADVTAGSLSSREVADRAC
jgi:hypothetical protein